MQSKKTSGRDWTDPVQTVWTAVRTGLWRTLLDAVLTPPAGGVWASGGPRQILAGQTVPRLELVETRGEAFVGF